MNSLRFRNWYIVVALTLPMSLITDPTTAANCPAGDEFLKNAEETEVDREALLKRVVDLCPNHGPALNDLALIQEKKGNFRAAATLYRRAISAGDAGAAPYAGLGDVLQQIGNYSGAAAAYKRFLSALPGEVLKGDPNKLLDFEVEYRSKLNAVLTRLGKEPGFSELMSSSATTRSLTGDPNKRQRQSREEEPSFSELLSASAITKSLTRAPKRTRGLSVLWHDRPFIDVHINFEFDSANISSGSMAQLKEIAKSLNTPALQETRILIEGHTDSTGSASYNQQLSRKRAKSVQSVLKGKYSVDVSRTEIKGYGESRPVAPNETPKGQARNRRVTFVNISWK